MTHEKNVLSIYIPKDKLPKRPIQRLAALAEKRDRAVNKLAVQAIMEYLAREAPLETDRLKKDKSSELKQPSPVRALSEDDSKRASEDIPADEGLGDKFRVYAASVAREIDQGGGPSFVEWLSQDKVHVVVSKAFPPEGHGGFVSLEQWRRQFRQVIANELNGNGWKPLGGNRFLRPGAVASSPVADRQSVGHKAARAGCLIPALCLLGGTMLLALVAVEASLDYGTLEVMGPIAMGLRVFHS